MKRRPIQRAAESLRETLRNLRHYPSVVRERGQGRQAMVPPSEKSYVGDGDFEAVGDEFLGHFVKLGGLQPDHRVLDVGCGIGRMAIPLTDYLSKSGEYWGFDVVAEGPDWCQRKISPRFWNFHFQHCDICNERYNPGGQLRSEQFEFPYADGFFDFVFLTSVFTHMFPADVENYVKEIARVMKAGGSALITFFVINDVSSGAVEAGTSALPFTLKQDGYYTTDPNLPEAAIAYDEDYVRELFAANGLTITEPIHYGAWAARETFTSFQDIVVATKPGLG